MKISPVLCVASTLAIAACTGDDAPVKNTPAEDIIIEAPLAGPVEEDARAELPTDEALTAALFDEISGNPAFLRVFLRPFPKGGDLHIHSDGTPYAEEFLDWAEDRAYCIHLQEEAIAPPPCLAPETAPAAGLATRDIETYYELVDALSVRPLLQDSDAGVSGHEQFFATFDKFGAISTIEDGKVLASIKRAADRDSLLYVELMELPSSVVRATLSSRDTDWDPSDFDGALARFEPEMQAIVQQGLADMDQGIAEAEVLLGCEQDETSPGCDVTVYYQCFALRLFPNDQVFRQLATCFAMAEADPRIVGINMVQPEDDPRAIGNYDLHMRMVAFLSERYPTAGISLHAGELTLGLAPNYALASHIADAIEIAGAQRIGHGVDISYETGSRETLVRMARENIAVEINLSSNDVILGVTGKDHPLNLYRASGVPYVLSSDDQGVLRTDLTEQYVRAALEHGLDYLDLKTASRNSLEYAFLPGESLWESDGYITPVEDCAEFDSAACDTFTAANPKAALQQRLELAFQAFEADISTWSIEVDGG